MCVWGREQREGGREGERESVHALSLACDAKHHESLLECINEQRAPSAQLCKRAVPHMYDINQANTRERHYTLSDAYQQYEGTYSHDMCVCGRERRDGGRGGER